MGWAAYFRDTEGNVVGLWQNAPREGGAGAANAERHRRLTRRARSGRSASASVHPGGEPQRHDRQAER